MRILAVKNAENEELEYIEDVLESKNIEFDYLMAKELGESLEELKDYSHVIILGGPQGVYEANKHPYLKTEMDLVRKAVELKKPVLGICLGAQLIAGAFGARVYPYIKELGWYEVENIGFEGMPERFTVFQWHGDTFDLPEKAKLLFKGETVANQGFSIKTALALQFHLEVKKETVRKWLKNEKNLSEEEKERIIEDTDKYISDLNRNTRVILQKFLNVEF
ncbi:MAG: type 1 glutamine amidotransferase [Archaeoglobus sp.]|nr:type 1 glutamine amidotransferase [Archaeoglobus sp.]